jgi:hypothetical protein
VEEMIEQYGNEFCKVAISFLKERILHQQQQQLQTASQLGTYFGKD